MLDNNKNRSVLTKKLVAVAAMALVATVLDRSCCGSSLLVEARRLRAAEPESKGDGNSDGAAVRNLGDDTKLPSALDAMLVADGVGKPSVQTAKVESKQSNPEKKAEAGKNGANKFADGPIKVACVGDSITAIKGGCGVPEGKHYTDHLQSMLGPNYIVSNYGKAGQTLMKGGQCKGEKGFTWDCSYWSTSEFEKVVESDSQVIVIMLGTNDAKRVNWYGEANGTPAGQGTGFIEDYQNLTKILRRAKQGKKRPLIYLVVPPPVVPPPDHPDYPVQFDIDPDVVNNRLPVAIQTVADSFKRKVYVVDTQKALGGAEGYFREDRTCDGIHPSLSSAFLIAGAVVQSIAPRRVSDGMLAVKLKKIDAAVELAKINRAKDQAKKDKNERQQHKQIQATKAGGGDIDTPAADSDDDGVVTEEDIEEAEEDIEEEEFEEVLEEEEEEEEEAEEDVEDNSSLIDPYLSEGFETETTNPTENEGGNYSRRVW